MLNSKGILDPGSGLDQIRNPDEYSLWEDFQF